MSQRLVLVEASKSTLALWKPEKLGVQKNLESTSDTSQLLNSEVLVSTILVVYLLAAVKTYCIHQRKFGVSVFKYLFFLNFILIIFTHRYPFLLPQCPISFPTSCPFLIVINNLPNPTFGVLNFYYHSRYFLTQVLGDGSAGTSSTCETFKEMNLTPNKKSAPNKKLGVAESTFSLGTNERLRKQDLWGHWLLG